LSYSLTKSLKYPLDIGLGGLQDHPVEVEKKYVPVLGIEEH
jgi:hypothetical protein